MMAPEATSVCAEVSGLGLVAIASVPALRRIVRRLFLLKRRDYQAVRERYEDKDGVATAVSINAFSDKIQRAIVLCCSIIGFSASLAVASIATLTRRQTLALTEWLQFAIWVGL